MNTFKVSILSLLILSGCKSADKLNSEFKRDVQGFYPNSQLCFKADKSMKVANFGRLLFKKDTLGHEKKWKLTQDFSSGKNCKLVALSDRLNDSIIVGMVYTYKSDIDQTLDEYSNWFYRAKVFVKTNNGKKAKMDTITVRFNPPVNSPWINEKLDKN